MGLLVGLSQVTKPEKYFFTVNDGFDQIKFFEEYLPINQSKHRNIKLR
jgi:hypothetical protein